MYDLPTIFLSIQAEDFRCPTKNCNAHPNIEILTAYVPEIDQFEEENPNDTETCQICFEEFKCNKTNLQIFGCEHFFCRSCTLNFLKEKITNRQVKT